MKAIERLFVFFEKKNLKHTPVEKDLGLTNGYLGKMRNRKGSIGSDILETIFYKYPELNPDWLLTGRGSMLRDSETSEENKSSSMPVATPISPAEESIIYKMYKDEKEEKERMLKEKAIENKQLQSELLAAREELAALKSKYPEALTNTPEGLDTSETALHAQSHPHSPTSEHYHGGSL